MEYELCIYRFDDNELEILVSPSEETVWLSLGDMAALFDRDRSVIGKHVKNVLSEWLGKTPVWAKIARTGPDGKRYDVDCYNLDVVVSVGNRIKSKNTQPFFNWCQQTLLGLRKDHDYGQPNLIRFDDGNVSLDVRIAPEEDTVYLSQTQIARLFDATQQNVSLHIRNILEEGELTLSATRKEFLLVQMEGQR